MKVFVINENQIKKAGLMVAVLLVAVFLLGYFLGGKQIVFMGEMGQPLALNKPAETGGNESRKMEGAGGLGEAVNDNKSQKKKVNNDKKKAEKSTLKNKEAKKLEKSKREKSKREKDKKKKDTKKTSKTKVSKNSEIKKSNINKPSSNKKNPDKKTPAKKEKTEKTAINKKPPLPAVDASSKTVAALPERIYSIQTGMFSSEVNAKSFIEKLSAKQFDAYLSSFVSSSGALKYNVRVGKFEKREQARTLLKEFQKSFSSPAYVVIAAP